MTDQAAEKEKSDVALSSVAAAVALTILKFVVGLATGSLGILAEAAHSALDFIAALMTLIAVRVAGKPADREHPYGHGKVENLSALLETMLLLATCAWIVYGAAARLITGSIEVEVTFWSFAVMIISIVVDILRSRALMAMAVKHNSQALEADALHFKTDIWSSSVVILGLVCVAAGNRWPPLQILQHGDAVAALFVAVIVVWVSVQLARRAVYSLIDSAPAGMEEEIIKAVEEVPGVTDCHNVRMRYSGPKPFVDIHVLVDGEQTLREAHALTECIEDVIRRLLPEADVTVHPEPRAKEDSCPV